MPEGISICGPEAQKSLDPGDPVRVVGAQGQVPAQINASIAGVGGGRGVCRADSEEWPEVGEGGVWNRGNRRHRSGVL